MSDTLWRQLVKNVCGFDIVKGSQPVWYRAMITICPYFSKPVVCKTSFKNMRKFELAKRKADDAVVLWCEREKKADDGNTTTTATTTNDWSYIQQSGKLNRKIIITPDDVTFNVDDDKPASGIPIPSLLLRDWVRFGKGRQQFQSSDVSTIRWIDFHYCEGMKVFQLHKNLFAACCNIKSRTRLIFFTMDLLLNNETTTTTTPTTTTTTASMFRVLHTMRVFVSTLQVPSKQKAFVSHDTARLCVRTNADEVTCYGPTRSDFRSWKLDSSVSLRRIFRGEATSAKLEDQFTHTISSREKQQIDHITGWTLLRCALTERKCEISMDIARLAEKHHGHLKTDDDSDGSPLFVAIEAGFVSMVRYLVSQTSIRNFFMNYEGCSTFGIALNNPEILEIMLSSFSSRHEQQQQLHTLWIQFRLNCVMLCEPALHVIKNQVVGGLHLSETNSLRLMQTVITKNMFDDDMGLLVMNARFLRTLIIMDNGEYMDETKKAALIRYAFYNSCFYMANFLEVEFR
jgi:hypothetical protein